MDIVARNPYRILGVFANNSIKKRTANIGRIRAFSKVNKQITFKVDGDDFIGKISRSIEDVDAANAALADRTEAALLSFFWFHQNSSFNEEQIASLRTNQFITTVKEQLLIGEYSGFINAAVISLVVEDYDSAVRYYVSLIESGTLLESFRESIDYAPTFLSNKEFIQKFIKKLVDEYPDVDWWPLFLKNSKKRVVLKYVKQVFEDIAIDLIKEKISKARNVSNVQSLDYLLLAQQLKRETIPCVKALEPLTGMEQSASAQLALDRLCTELIRECSNYYNSEKDKNEQSVLPTLQLTRYAISLASGSETLEDGKAFLTQLEEDKKRLPPKEVYAESRAIKAEIASYCQQPDEIRWALTLVRNCVPYLVKIKEKLGLQHSYYLRISTRIADNALYNSDAEIKSKLDAQETLFANEDDLKDTIRNAWKLHLDISALDLDSDFKNGKLHENGAYIMGLLNENNIQYNDIRPDISIYSDDELYQRCSDYYSLFEFCRIYPNSPHFAEAMQKIWKIENSDFPLIPNVKNLLNYKAKYPLNHNDSKVLTSLDDLLLGDINGTIYEYRQFLRLYPNHNRRLEILYRIDFLSFSQCKTLQDFQQYFQDFKNGAFRKEARIRVNELLYANKSEDPEKIEGQLYRAVCQNKHYQEYLDKYPSGKYYVEVLLMQERYYFYRCNTVEQYQGYLKKYPNGRFVDEAKKKIRKKESMPYILMGCLFLFLLGCLIIAFRAAPVSNMPVQDTSTTVQVADSDSIAPDTTITADSDSAESISADDEAFIDNHLQTGDKPYSYYFGKSHIGRKYIIFNTSGDRDYVIIVKKAIGLKYMNHVYINGGDRAKIYLPNGKYIVYFYSGNGWNPNKVKGDLLGGFVSKESVKKDGPIDMTNNDYEYTLYPVENGNLRLNPANDDEVFN